MSFPPPPPTGPPPSHPPYPPFGPPPQKGNGARVALVVGGVLLAIVLLGVVAVGAFLVAGGGDDGRAADHPTRSRTTSAPSSEATSEATSETTSETTATPGTGPTTPYTPSDDTDDDIHNDVKVADFPGNWDFKLGDVEHHATLVSSTDHASCAPVEKGSVLTDQRCTYAAQWVFNALGGKVRMTHLFLVFDTERHAKAAQGAMKDTDFELPDGSIYPSFVQGQWNSSVYGNIVAVTIGTSKVKVNEKKLNSLVNYMNTDFKTALLFKS
jgi:hypothetical protein